MSEDAGMRVCVIVNPRAGRGTGPAVAETAEAEFARAGWQVQRVVTQGPGDAERLAAEAVADGHAAIFACGGDGTLSQALAGALDSGVPVGLVPAGTGNDFARTIGLSLDAAAAARELVAGGPADVDLLSVNDGALWTVNVIGTGFDARVAERINRRARLTGGMMDYMISLAQELISHQASEFRVTVDGETWEGRALLVAVANARCYGGGMFIAPMADVRDGLLDVVMVKQMGRVEFLRTFRRVLRGTHLQHRAVRHWQGREVTIETGGACPVSVDGDVQCQTPLRVRVCPGRARVWLPGS